MANYENVKYLSLPQQVRQNQLQIEKLLTMYSLVYTTLVAIQNRTYLTKAELIETNRNPIVGDLVYGSDSYYAQIIRVGEGIVELTVIGQIANLQAIYDLVNLKADLTYVNNQLALTAKLAVSNVFTQPQQVPNATLPQHATNKLQVETMFEMFKRELRGYNLAGPDLSSRTYLGNGVYDFGQDEIEETYNVYNGVIYRNNVGQRFYSLNFPDLVGTYTIRMFDFQIEGLVTQPIFILREKNYGAYIIERYPTNFNITLNLINGFSLTNQNGDFQSMSFKFQIVKGTVATPYTVPGEIPQYKIVGEE